MSSFERAIKEREATDAAIALIRKIVATADLYEITTGQSPDSAIIRDARRVLGLLIDSGLVTEGAPA